MIMGKFPIVSSGDRDQEMSVGKKIPKWNQWISVSFILSSINWGILHLKGLGLFSRLIKADQQTKLYLSVHFLHHKKGHSRDLMKKEFLN